MNNKTHSAAEVQQLLESAGFSTHRPVCAGPPPPPRGEWGLGCDHPVANSCPRNHAIHCEIGIPGWWDPAPARGPAPSANPYYIVQQGKIQQFTMMKARAPWQADGFLPNLENAKNLVFITAPRSVRPFLDTASYFHVFRTMLVVNPLVFSKT